MSNLFTIIDRHLDAPRTPNEAGKLVLSRLKGGTSQLNSQQPSLKIVLEGECFYEVDGKSVRVQPGQFLYLDSGAGCVATHRSDMIGMCLVLPPREIVVDAERNEDRLLGRSLVLSTRTSVMGRTLESYGRRIARDPSLGHRIADKFVRRMSEALQHPLDESEAVMARLKAVKLSTRRTLFQRLERARGHLHDNECRAVSLAELASVASLSQFHLARYFKLAFGSSPIAYHRRLRLERAGMLLMLDNHSLSEVADLTGYSDDVALSHAFRRHYGKPPQLWAMQRRSMPTY